MKTLKKIVHNIETVEPEILLFLCKTPTKKTLELDQVDNEATFIILTCEMEGIEIVVLTKFDKLTDAIDFQNRCLEWLNY